MAMKKGEWHRVNGVMRRIRDKRFKAKHSVRTKQPLTAQLVEESFCNVPLKPLEQLLDMAWENMPLIEKLRIVSDMIPKRHLND